MKKQAAPGSVHNVFAGGASTADSQRYTQIWIQLIDQMERSKEILAGIRR